MFLWSLLMSHCLSLCHTLTPNFVLLGLIKILCIYLVHKHFVVNTALLDITNLNILPPKHGVPSRVLYKMHLHCATIIRCSSFYFTVWWEWYTLQWCSRVVLSDSSSDIDIPIALYKGKYTCTSHLFTIFLFFSFAIFQCYVYFFRVLNQFPSMCEKTFLPQD